MSFRWITRKDKCIEDQISGMIVKAVSEANETYRHEHAEKNRDRKVLNLKLNKIKDSELAIEYDIEISTKHIYKHYEPPMGWQYVNGVRGKEKEITVSEHFPHLSERQWGNVNISAIIGELGRTVNLDDSDIVLSSPQTLEDSISEIQSLKRVLIALVRSLRCALQN